MMENLFDHFGVGISENPPGTSDTCNTCEHRQRWKCNSKVIQYYGIRTSNRTDNGLLKIKCKNKACELYKLEKSDGGK